MSTEVQNSHTSEWVWAALSAAYLLSPVDVIPDIPVVGWVDDFFCSYRRWAQPFARLRSR